MPILRAYGVPAGIVDTVNMMYTNTTAQVLSPDGDTEFFEIQAELSREIVWRHIYLIIALDYAMRQAVGNESNLGFTLDESRSRRHLAKVICDTAFVDDIAVLSNTLEQAQLLLSRVETSAKQTGLHINNSKTEYIRFNQDEGDLKAFNGESLQNADDCLYLGSWIDCCSKAVNVRTGKAWSALHKLDTVWKSEHSDGLKIAFFRAMVETVLLYGSTAWTLTQFLDKKLERHKPKS